MPELRSNSLKNGNKITALRNNSEVPLPVNIAVFSRRSRYQSVDVLFFCPFYGLLSRWALKSHFLCFFKYSCLQYRCEVIPHQNHHQQLYRLISGSSTIHGEQFNNSCLVSRPLNPERSNSVRTAVLSLRLFAVGTEFLRLRHRQIGGNPDRPCSKKNKSKNNTCQTISAASAAGKKVPEEVYQEHIRFHDTYRHRIQDRGLLLSSQ